MTTGPASRAAAAPPCPPPDPHPRGPVRYAVPPGAVDCHAHVIGSPPEHPFVDGRSYTPPPASEADYLGMLDATGMAYGVLVQVSVHGTDNSLMLRVLRRHPRRLRGVAVMPLGLPARQYDEARRSGVAGLRLNVLYGGGVGLGDLEEYGALARDLGWHLQLLVDARRIASLASRIAALPVPVVIDHMGHFPARQGLAHPGVRTMLDLVRDGAWVKLSGAYRLDEAPWRHTIPLARACLEIAPERCVWGSDWPHVSHWASMMNVGDLLDLLADWAPDPATRERVLVRNAHALYGWKQAAR
ncbi:amidohydrolase [Pigmentiphaga soli]|uniref:Amidohydrolase n=1 Tax=Pigmentiphaga soli TaxID=1007095 RepID=A0ABP8H1M7_9BURK